MSYFFIEYSLFDKDLLANMAKTCIDKCWTFIRTFLDRRTVVLLEPACDFGTRVKNIFFGNRACKFSWRPTSELYKINFRRSSLKTLWSIEAKFYLTYDTIRLREAIFC